MVAFGQCGCLMAKVTVFGQIWFYSGKNGCIRANWLYSGNVVVFVQSGCIRAKEVVLGQSF